MKFRTGYANYIVYFSYLAAFIGCYTVASGYIGVWASYKFVNSLYRSNRKGE